MTGSRGSSDEGRPDPMQSFYERQERARPSGDPISTLEGPALFAEVRRRAGSPLSVRTTFAAAPWFWVMAAVTRRDDEWTGVFAGLFAVAAAWGISYYVYMGRAGLLGSMWSKAYGRIHGWVMLADSRDDLAATAWEKRVSAIGYGGFAVAFLAALSMLV